MNFDSVTINPYMGSDSVKPFLEFENKISILLGLTSNTGAKDIQLKKINNDHVFIEMIKSSMVWGNEDNMMYVVGATKPQYIEKIRELIPNHFLLMPGVGAQGGDLNEICKYALNDNIGILVKRYLFDATPDLHNQLRFLESFSSSTNLVDGIFLTHAHIGHYTGLMYLGREGLGGAEINVYALDRMSKFLKNNGPWNQLVDLKNIVINKMQNKNSVILSKNLEVIPIQVPHRDEYSETVGYKIIGKSKKI